MTRLGELESALTGLKHFKIQQNGKDEDLLSLLKDFDVLLNNADGIILLKEPNKYFETLLPLFTDIIYCDDLSIAKAFFKYFEVITNIFQSKLPIIKREKWWKTFELEHLGKCIPKLVEKTSPSDGSWVEIWSFTAHLIVSGTALSTLTLNRLLTVVEISFGKGKYYPEILDQAWQCWGTLVDAFGRFPNILLPAKTLNLLLKPLLACQSVSKLRISTWTKLVDVIGITHAENTVKQLVESFCKAMYTAPGEKVISRHLPEECSEALLKLLQHTKVIDHCMENIVCVFGACVYSKPAAGTIEKLACALINAINGTENAVVSFNLWKTLLEQYKSCKESPILSQACEVFFTGVNFQRWVDSGTIERKVITELMSSSDFTSSITLSRVVSYIDDDANDCVMVPAKRIPLTESQVETTTKRRTDIPAIYQDSPQDTDISNPPFAIIQEIACPCKIKDECQAQMETSCEKLVHLKMDDENRYGKENVIPVTFGKNWPQGPTEDWVACTPLSPSASPFRSVLKRAPQAGNRQSMSRGLGQESLGSPLLSSTKKKRVAFFDPPVTKGLTYERGSPFGAVYLADIPQGSLYPTWKGDDNAPSQPESELNKTPTNSITIPISELEYCKLKDEYQIEDGFIEQLSNLSLQIRGLVAHCFKSIDMQETVDGWKLGDCRKICAMPHSFLSSVKNERGQSLIEILKAVNLIPAVVEVPVKTTAESQTESTKVPISHSGCQTDLQTCTVATNTDTLIADTVNCSTQADHQLPLPGELLPILERCGTRKAMDYCSDYLRILSSLQDVQK